MVRKENVVSFVVVKVAAKAFHIKAESLGQFEEKVGVVAKTENQSVIGFKLEIVSVVFKVVSLFLERNFYYLSVELF